MSNALITAIGVLVDGDSRMHLSGVITHTTRGAAREIPFTANGRTGEWEYRSERTTVSKDHHGVITESRGSRIETREDRDHVPFELRIAFPLALPIWDRASDEWRMLSAEQNGDEVTITLVHREHRALRSTLVVDTARRLVSSFTTPTDSCVLLAPVDEESPGRYAAYEG